jgi:Ca2+-binding RTX toxin-like protein
MRRTTMLVVLVAVLVVAVAAPVAYAAVKEGNAGDNYIRETCGNDTLIGRGGSDTLDANNCGGDTDILKGNRGNDRLLVNDNDSLDAASGGPGWDLCVVDRRLELAGGCNKIRIR